MKRCSIMLMLLGTYSTFAQVLVTPSSTINGLTHSFRDLYPGGPTSVIEDYAAAGQYTQTGFTTTLTGSETISVSFEAPVGEMFVIHAAPAGFGDITLTLDAEWIAGSGSGYGLSAASTSAVFENLIGSAPTLTSSSDYISTGGDSVRFFDTFTIAPGTTFTGVQLSAQYATSISSPSEQTFIPSAFEFNAGVESFQTLGDGTLMTLEATPEPGIFSFLALGSLAFLYHHRNAKGA